VAAAHADHQILPPRTGSLAARPGYVPGTVTPAAVRLLVNITAPWYRVKARPAAPCHLSPTIAHRRSPVCPAGGHLRYRLAGTRHWLADAGRPAVLLGVSVAGNSRDHEQSGCSGDGAGMTRMVAERVCGVVAIALVFPYFAW
jgi:hypothetical protein